MSVFKFKQFEVIQQNSAAKIGTDGVLHGAWAKIPPNAQRALDIGSGTGLIALMLAQRFDFLQITAVEKDEISFKEAGLNFRNSPWHERLMVIHSEIEKFTTEEKFDLIVSNPPFFNENTFAPSERRNNARNAISLSSELLISKTAELLSDTGYFSVIIPFEQEENFCFMAIRKGLFPFQILQVQGTKQSPFKRSLIAFGRSRQLIETKKMFIEKERHLYSDDYKRLTQDFYLNM